MVNTQLINFSGKNEFSFIVDEVNALGNSKTFDSFDLNIIDLRADLIWRNDSQYTNYFDSRNDFLSLNNILGDSTNSHVLFILPQNILFKYHYINQYHRSTLLKDMISDLETHLQVIMPLLSGNLKFGKNDTVIQGEKVSSDFYFPSIPSKAIASLQSNGSQKYIAYTEDNLTVTSLAIENQDQLRGFLLDIKIITEAVEETPEWMKEVKMFDDQVQHKLIDNKMGEIKAAELMIAGAEKQLFNNNRLKSILFTQSDSLVEVVFEILEEITGCDLTEFEDLRKEDFVFEINENIYIGEIKGVNSNIKNANVSQLDVHYQNYLDEHEGVEKDNVYSLLIMNHQKNKPLSDRQPVTQDQIELAQRNKSLIIETITLLRMLELYREGEMTREDCIKKISDKDSGILIID